MEFVDDYRAGSGKQSRDLKPAQDEESLKGLGRDEEDSSRSSARTRLDGLGDVTMPRMDRQLCRGAQFLQTLELVVDQGTKGTHVDQIETTFVRMFKDMRNEREECGLGLAASGRRRDDDVSIVIENGRDRTFLNVAQALPTFTPDPATDRLREPRERRGLPRA